MVPAAERSLDFFFFFVVAYNFHSIVHIQLGISHNRGTSWEPESCGDGSSGAAVAQHCLYTRIIIIMLITFTYNATWVDRDFIFISLFFALLFDFSMCVFFHSCLAFNQRWSRWALSEMVIGSLCIYICITCYIHLPDAYCFGCVCWAFLSDDLIRPDGPIWISNLNAFRKWKFE